MKMKALNALFEVLVVFLIFAGCGKDGGGGTVPTISRAAPTISSAASVTFIRGTAGNFTVTTKGVPMPTLSYTGTLPEGVTFNIATGVLSGTPTGAAGTYHIVITANNGVNPSAVQSFTLTLQVTPLNGLTLNNAVSTLAGGVGVSGTADGTGTAARFGSPEGITTDGVNLYVADTDKHTIRKIVISSGDVTTIAGSAGLYGSVDGIGAAARFYYPSGIATDGVNLYVTDSMNCTIRKIIIATGATSTIAGTAGLQGSSDGIGAATRFNFPGGITTDGVNLYVSDSNNKTIRNIVISTGVVTTIAGKAGVNGSVDGIGVAARFHYPTSICNDGVNLYIVDTSDYTIRKLAISTGEVTTIAGLAGISGAADGIGTVARFSFSSGITTDGVNLYVTDSSNDTIRKIVISTLDVTTIAGSAGTIGSVDGTGTVARFSYPHGITTDGISSLFVIDFGNHTIRQIH